jgi:hypothetical protein
VRERGAQRPAVDAGVRLDRPQLGLELLDARRQRGDTLGLRAVEERGAQLPRVSLNPPWQ